MLFKVGVSVVLVAGLVGCSLRPSPGSNLAFQRNAQANILRMTADQEPISGSISLEAAMARALKYNLDLRVKRDQVMLANAKLNLQHYSMLPTAVIEAGYVRRNNDNASTSLDLLSNTRDASFSTSQDRRQRSSDISISWDILDFGLSYVRAKQAADDVLISREAWRKEVHQLLEDVRVEYWRASTYQRLIDRLHKLKKRTDAAIANSERLSKENQLNRLTVLNSERELIKVKQAINDLEQNLLSAKAELARLMNLKPGTDFTLDVTRATSRPNALDLPLDELLEIAVAQRPELRRNWYEQRINVQEAKAQVLSILPSLRGYVSHSDSSNSFLANGSWMSAGAAVSWSLIKAFEYPAKAKANEARQQILERQALALSMAVVTQVYLSLLQHDYFTEKLDLADKHLSVQKRITRQMRMEARAKRVSEQELILEEMNELIAEAKYDISFAEMQKAYGGLISSLGLEDPVSLDRRADVKTLSSAIESEWNADLHSRVNVVRKAQRPAKH
ncbi:TolC family protein [Rhizobium sp. SL86]|uniref:TolC family protein n=1 Tax=Rhizobium sp. SL86 TaxID=2995148 RepID=UPI0022769544|nr:TolC family protein [Rhizobium sp. SL86]MCY1667732.1 TolC family protein [Rhizobium sp. SL86]